MMRSGHAGPVSQSLIRSVDLKNRSVWLSKVQGTGLMPTTSTSNRPNAAEATDFMSEFAVNIESSGPILQLLRSNEKITQYIQQGMQFVTEAACDAEELKLEDKVSYCQLFANKPFSY